MPWKFPFQPGRATRWWVPVSPWEQNKPRNMCNHITSRTRHRMKKLPAIESSVRKTEEASLTHVKEISRRRGKYRPKDQEEEYLSDENSLEALEQYRQYLGNSQNVLGGYSLLHPGCRVELGKTYHHPDGSRSQLSDKPTYFPPLGKHPGVFIPLHYPTFHHH